MEDGMLDDLNRYGKPVKYGVVGFFAGILGALLSEIFGFTGAGLSTYVSMPIAAAIGGAIGGWLRGLASAAPW